LIPEEAPEGVISATHLCLGEGIPVQSTIYCEDSWQHKFCGCQKPNLNAELNGKKKPS